MVTAITETLTFFIYFDVPVRPLRHPEGRSEGDGRVRMQRGRPDRFPSRLLNRGTSGGTGMLKRDPRSCLRINLLENLKSGPAVAPRTTAFVANKGQEIRYARLCVWPQLLQ